MFRLILVAAVIALFAYIGWLWFDEDSEFGELPDIEETVLDLQEVNPLAGPPAAEVGADPVVEPEAVTVDAVAEDETPLDAPLEVAPPEGMGRLDGEGEADDPAVEGERDEAADAPADAAAAETTDDDPDTGDDQPPEG
jgi:hypothetical protein